MKVYPVVPGLHRISLGVVNAFLIEENGDLLLIDTGMPPHAKDILKAIDEVSRKPQDLKYILLTHCHPDHVGGVADLIAATGAVAYMHPFDEAVMQKGDVPRLMKPAPGFFNKLLFELFIKRGPRRIKPAQTQKLEPGTVFPFADGIEVIHAPGHCYGQFAFLWYRHKVLFAADTAANMGRLALSIGYENLQMGKNTLRDLSRMDFDVACFGHGKDIVGNASQRFRKKWAVV